MNKTAQQPPTEVRKEMTPEEITAAQKKGNLIYRPIPYEAEGQTRIKTSDGATYNLKGKTLRRLAPKVRMSKKERRLARKLLAGGREVVPHRSGDGEVLNPGGERS